MSTLFGTNIAQALATALGGIVFDLVLSKSTTTEDPSDSTARLKILTPYPCKGYTGNYVNENWNSTNIQTTDVKIVILVATLQAGIVPEPGDTIEAEGRTFVIQEKGVVRDSAASTYECRSN